jgi:hypothetical protein
LNFELDDLDHRAIGEALTERMGRLIRIVEDTTRTFPRDGLHRASLRA